MNSKHVFPDVNVLLHFPAFDGFHWANACDAERVVVHITQPLLKELNKVKDTAHSKAIRRRAGTLQKQLKARVKSGEMQLSERTILKFDSQSIKVGDHPGLDPNVADDALIAAALNFLNIARATESYFSVTMATRAILDHVPPLFGVESFAQVSNNYQGSKSFKASMQNLEKSSRNIADQNLHCQIRATEVLPNATQVNFSNDLDVLLAEIVRMFKKAS